jgi:toxin ParE1/3/4
VLVRLSPRALSDLEELTAYIAADSPQNARLVRERIQAALLHLTQQPHLGRPGRKEGTRELVIPRTGYIAAYRVVDTAGGPEVQVAAIIPGAQRWPDDL